MQRINTNLLQEAFGLGAPAWRAYWRVYFPLTLPGVLAGVTLVFILSMGFFITPALLGGGPPVGGGVSVGGAGGMGMRVGGRTSGLAVAIFMANAGGAGDNAKKYIEKGNYGGKGSDAHKATIVGDTVGDPFKDTSGPSLNILIKLMSMVSVVFAGLIVKYAPKISSFLGLD